MRRRHAEAPLDGGDSKRHKAAKELQQTPSGFDLDQTAGKFLKDTASPKTLLVTVLALGKRLYARSGETSLRPFLFQISLTLVLLVVNTGMSLWFSFKLRAFTSALQQKDQPAFSKAMFEIFFVVILLVPAAAGKRYTAGALSLFFRRHFTRALFNDYFSNLAFYHLQVSNASLRLLEVEAWIEESQILSTTVVQSVLDLLGFSSLMFFLSFSLFGALFTYSLAGTLISVWYFFPRITAVVAELTEKRTRVTHALVRVQENKESIAFYRGGDRELSLLSTAFDEFISAARSHLHWSIGLDSFTQAYSYTTILLPYLVVAPLYFAGDIEYGVVTQSSMAFSRIKTAMNLIVNNFKGMATIAASTRRLRELLDEMDSIPPHADVLDQVAASNGNTAAPFALRIEGLVLHTPPPSPLLLCQALSFTMGHGDSLLITGLSGGGKSSLLRCFARLWQATQGSVTFGHSAAKVFFLPQQPYMPIGSLRDVLCYPDDPGETTLRVSSDLDSALSLVLEQVNLGHLEASVGGLDATRAWTEMLSHGEQQRIAFARLFIRQPAVVLLDEATSALDSTTELAMYRRLCELNPRPTVISVAHRDSVRQFHNSLLERRHDDSATWDLQHNRIDNEA